MENHDIMRRVRKPIKISESLRERLNSYALVATAAGVAVLACSQAAEAAPICKDLSVQLFRSDSYAFNPAGQAFAPFNLAQTTNFYSRYYSSTFISWNRAFFNPNSLGANVLLDARGLPVDVSPGAEIGPNGQFGKGASYALLFTYGKGPSSARGTLLKHAGNLDLQRANYIGFRFSLSGEAHYGWARLQLSVQQIGPGKHTIIQLLGYGYESVSNTAIPAGGCNAVTISQSGNKSEENESVDANKSGASSNGNTASDIPVGATLGMLARGNDGLFLHKNTAGGAGKR